MYPSFRRQINELKSDDIAGIQAIYGKPSGDSPGEIPILAFGLFTMSTLKFTLGISNLFFYTFRLFLVQNVMNTRRGHVVMLRIPWD